MPGALAQHEHATPARDDPPHVTALLAQAPRNARLRARVGHLWSVLAGALPSKPASGGRVVSRVVRSPGGGLMLGEMLLQRLA